ncbi:DUF885-domain-containing protein [Rhizoclosmatium globosum]|uniref:DUF885-domain-containing protein n=1 Tax=Rhizoclosmatium globosum TaxID=329046 RepID=A0A1Y2CSQ3_9FUNG|nr:DUF885-domain-containing protein [Rhizoclosmatium globosum]|eukprot:ORY49926.1 DUF885-domain-containing protein [Rhizoclosmatium globosum]
MDGYRSCFATLYMALKLNRSIDLQILHFNDRFVDLLLTLNPLLAPTYGITRYPDRVFSVSRTAHVQFFKGLLYLRTQVDKLAESLLTKKQKEEVKFLKSAIERSLVREGIPGDVGFVLELGNKLSELAMLEYWFSLQPTKTGQDLINHNTRLLLLPAQFTHMIENFNLGIKRQATLTKRCTELLIKTVHGLCRPDLPITQAAKLSGLNREKEAKDLLGSPDFFVPALVEVVQSLRGIKVYLETIYIQNARDMDGIGGIPGAEDAYRRYIYEFTDSYTSADEFHALGIAEVERIQKELEDVKEQCGYRGSLAQFQRDLMDRSKYPQLFLRTKKEVVEYCENVVKRNKEMMAGFFDEFPTLELSGVLVLAAEKFTNLSISCRVEAVAPELESQRPIASYYSGTDTTHHHQGTLANANKSNHVIRKIMMSEPYLDGWALYSEYLGKEMGVYETPFEVFGKLTMEMLRACRLVVDTGMHAKGWSVEEAVDIWGVKLPCQRRKLKAK